MSDVNYPDPETKSLKTIVSAWPQLSSSQKISLVSLVLLVIIMPIGILVTITPKLALFTKATTVVTPPVTPPLDNTSPIINTNSLPEGQLGKNYKAVIKGYDLDLNDNLVMTVQNLPERLRLGRCKTTRESAKTIISCGISGRPLQTGSFDVLVTLKDSFGNSTQKTLILHIN